MIVRANAGSVWFWCPGCNDAHRINETWQFNGSAEKPTIQPSILVSRPANPDAAPGFEEYRQEKRCHSFVTDGMIQFLDDSTHTLAGKTIPLPELPDWLANP